MLAGIGEGLLHDPVHARLQLAREAFARVVALEGECDLGLNLQPSAASPVQERHERRLEAELIERRRTQLGDERTQRRDVELELIERLVDRPGHERRVSASPSAREDETEVAERLEGLVVQLARPPTALNLRRGQALAAALVGGRLRGGDRRRGAGGKGLEQVLVLGAELAVIEMVDCHKRRRTADCGTRAAR